VVGILDQANEDAGQLYRRFGRVEQLGRDSVIYQLGAGCDQLLLEYRGVRYANLQGVRI